MQSQHRHLSRLGPTLLAGACRGNRVEGSANGHSQPAAQKRKTAVQAVMEQEEQMKQMKAQRAAAAAPAALLPTAETLKKAGDKPWLHKRIIVKVRPGHSLLPPSSSPNLSPPASG